MDGPPCGTSTQDSRGGGEKDSRHKIELLLQYDGDTNGKPSETAVWSFMVGFLSTLFQSFQKKKEKFLREALKSKDDLKFKAD